MGSFKMVEGRSNASREVCGKKQEMQTCFLLQGN